MTPIERINPTMNNLKELVLDTVHGKKNYFSGLRRNETTPVTIVGFKPLNIIV